MVLAVDREVILDLLEHLTGARITFSYFRVGGVCNDVDDQFLAGASAFVKRMRERLPMYHKLVTGNIIFRKRVEGVGEISREMALRYGATGPMIRGSGIPYDVRRVEPYSLYPEFDFDIPTSERGDCKGRYDVRMAEIEQSLRIVEQAIAKLYLTQLHPSG